MAIDNYKTVSKIGVKEMIKKATKGDYIICNPIEHYSIEEIKELSKLAKENQLLLTIKNETSNFYQGVLINLVKREIAKEDMCFIEHL